MTRALRCFVLLVVLFLLAQLPASAQENWVPQNSGTDRTLYRVQFLNADLGYVVGDSGMVEKTTDGGDLWTPVPVETAYPVRDLCFSNDSLGWVVTGDPNASAGSGSVWHTANGGTTWTQQPLGTTQARFGVSFVSDTRGWACGSNNGPWDIRSTTNGGTTWTSQSGSGFGWTYDIQCISPTIGWTVGVVYFPSASGFVLKTTNGGAVWSQQNTGPVPFLYGIQFVDSLHGYAVGDAGTVLGTVNGGTNWSTLNTGTTANLNDLSFLSGALGWVCGTGGKLLKTTDAGLTWDSLQTGTSQALKGVFFVDSATGWVVGDTGTILKGSPTTSVLPQPKGGQPESFLLSQNYPNPFNSATEIRFVLGHAARVSLKIYDLSGREVARLADAMFEAGAHNVAFGASGLPSGVYLYRLQTGSETQTRKMVLLK